MLISLLKSVVAQVALWLFAAISVFAVVFHYYKGNTELIGEFYIEPVQVILLQGEYLEDRLLKMKNKEYKDSIRISEDLINKLKK